MKIEMIGYNDTKTIAIYGNIKMLPFCISSFAISVLLLIPSLILQIYELLFVFILPTLLLLIMLIQYLVNSKYKTFLQNAKTKHKICLENGRLYKDGKVIKDIDDIKLYKFKNFLFLKLKKSYYRIDNSDYLSGSREEFLSNVCYLNRHHIYFDLPKKSDDEIIDLLFNDINLEGKERLFYSSDKTKIVYIYKNTSGSYSIGYETLTIFYDYERKYLHEYGMWEPSLEDNFATFYESIEAAYNDIKATIKDYTEMI